MARLAVTDVWPGLQSQSYAVYILYGHSESLAQGLVQEVQDTWHGVSLEAGDLLDFCHTVQSPLLFGSHPLCAWIQSGWSWSGASDLVKQWPQSCPLIVRTATCPPAWHKVARVATVACYECSVADSRCIFLRHLKRLNVHVSSDVLDWCAAGCAHGEWSSWAHTLSLLDQESCGDLGRVQALFGQRDDVSDLALFDKDMPPLAHVDPIKVIRSWQRSVVQVWQIKQGLHQGLASDRVLSLVSPPPFFKHEARLVAVARQWSLAKISRVLTRCVEAEVEMKQGSVLTVESLLSIWRLGQAG